MFIYFLEDNTIKSDSNLHTYAILLDSKDPWIDIDYTSTRYFSRQVDVNTGVFAICCFKVPTTYDSSILWVSAVLDAPAIMHAISQAALRAVTFNRVKQDRTRPLAEISKADSLPTIHVESSAYDSGIKIIPPEIYGINTSSFQDGCQFSGTTLSPSLKLTFSGHSLWYVSKKHQRSGSWQWFRNQNIVSSIAVLGTNISWLICWLNALFCVQAQLKWKMLLCVSLVTKKPTQLSPILGPFQYFYLYTTYFVRMRYSWHNRT